MLTRLPDSSPDAGLGHVTRCAALAAAWERRGTTTDWTVVDSYRATLDDQRAARERGRLLVIDDHGSLGDYDADLVLDQNLGASAASYPGARTLLGPRYALFREQFRSVRSGVRSGAVLSGGGEPSAVTSALLDGVANSLPRTSLLSGVTDVASTLASAAVFVGACGSTAYECCAVGTPMVLFAVADNQVPVGERLAAAGAAVYLGRVESVEVADVLAALADLDRAATGAAAAALVDGDGADRVAVQMRAFDIDLRAIGADDCRTIWEWSNDPDVRTTSFRSEPIEWEDHQRWFERQLRDPERVHYVASVGGQPLGQIRYECDGDRALLGYSIVAPERGCGWGAPLLVAGSRRLRDDRPTVHVVGRVKPDNTASARSFELAGFAG